MFEKKLNPDIMTQLRFLIVLTTLAWLSSCAQVEEKTIITVRGPIPAGEMGLTLVHEHVLVDFAGADSTGYHRWDKEEVVTRALPYLKEVQELGVQTLFECTPAYVGRDPWVLKSLSEKTGMHLVTNTGYYGAHGNHYIPQEFYELSARELAQVWIDEHVNGIEGSGVKPGFIKIAVDGDDSLSPDHVKIITAAALAHQQTGLVIASHTGPEKPAFAQIEVLKSHGIDPSSFIWVHAQRGSLEGNIKAARAGSWVSLDNVNANREEGSTFDISWYAERIAALKSAGLLHRVLISHDAGWYSPGEEQGGNFRGYTAIFKDLIPALEERGVTQKDVDQLLVKNPVEALSIKHIRTGA
jgi:phosphotriesterase-related protein